jgi:hypothetical protein
VEQSFKGTSIHSFHAWTISTAHHSEMVTTVNCDPRSLSSGRCAFLCRGTGGRSRSHSRLSRNCNWALSHSVEKEVTAFSVIPRLHRSYPPSSPLPSLPMLSHNVVVGGHFGDSRNIRLYNGCCSKQSRRGDRGDPDSSDRCGCKSQPRRRPPWAWTSAHPPALPSIAAAGSARDGLTMQRQAQRTI